MQGIRKEPEFEGHVLLAHEFNDGWLPVQLLLTARRVSQWAYQHLPAAMENPQAFLEHISKHLASKAMPAAGNSSHNVDSHNLSVAMTLPDWLRTRTLTAVATDSQCLLQNGMMPSILCSHVRAGGLV